VPDENTQGGVFCPSHPDVHAEEMRQNSSSYVPTLFDDFWNSSTVPCYLTIILVPLISIRSVSFFTKFNSLGETIFYTEKYLNFCL